MGRLKEEGETNKNKMDEEKEKRVKGNGIRAKGKMVLVTACLFTVCIMTQNETMNGIGKQVEKVTKEG